jgi:sugar phosphate isomerase/epimerase
MTRRTGCLEDHNAIRMFYEKVRIMINRRQFLASTAATVAVGLSSCSTSIRSATAPRRLRLSTSSILFKQLPIEQACERIAKLGFEAIDIWSAYDKCPHLDDVATRLGPEGLKAMLAKYRLRLVSFSVYVGGYAKYAELLGGAGGGVAIRGSAEPCQPTELRAKMRSFFNELKPLAELAEKHGSYLAIENHAHTLLDSLDSFRAFTQLNNSPRVGLAIAPYHLQAREESVVEAIRIAGRQLFFFYAWQKQEGINQLPGYGPADFRPWLDALAEADYRGFANPFMHGHVEPERMANALTKARSYLRQRAKPAWRT